MKIAVLCFKKNFNNYENTAFKNASLKLGVNLTLIDPDECLVKIKNNNIEIYSNDKLLPHFDYLLIRVGCMINIHIRHIIKAFKALNTMISIEADDISLLADKFSVHLLMQQINVDSINSIKARDITNYNFDYPVIFKSNTGSLGIGIYKANDEESLRNLVKHSQLLDNKYDFIIQDYIKHSFGVDLRVFVVNKKIVAVMKRESDGIDFKANFTLHNTASKYDIDEQITEIVNKISSNIDAHILGIDLLFTEKGYLVCEINSAPGFKGIEKVYPHLKVSEIIIKDIKNNFE